MKINFLLNATFILGLVLSQNILFARDILLPSSAQISQAVLGKGYNTTQESFTGDCVTGSSQYVGAPEASITFERSLSSNEVSDSLGFSVGAKARYGMISASAAARFASDSSSNDYSEATVYSAEYRFKNAKLHYTGLTDVGQKAVQGSGSYVWENWEKTCGHHFVEQIQLGAKIMISAKVEFSTKEDKRAFAAEFKIKGPAFSASAELQKASRRFGKTASVVIRAYQLGGEISRLSSIFGAGTDAKVDVQGKKVHALLICSMDRIDACTQVLDHAITYATDVSDPSAFPNQIKPEYDPKLPNGPAELAYITKPWSDLAFYPPPQIIADLVKVARATLSHRFEELLQLHRRTMALMNGPFRLSVEQYSRVENVYQHINENFSLIMNAATVCYTDVEKCPETVAHLGSQLKTIAVSALDVYPEIYAQWCDTLQSGTIKRSVKNTVEGLFNIANLEVDLSKVDDKCATAEDILLEEKRIDLGMLELKNLAPLASLPNIQVLFLHNNQIEDLSPLRSLRNLRELNINLNDVSDLTPIADLSRLEKLKANSNKITLVPENNEWKELKLLQLGHNHLEDISSLSSFIKLKNLSLNNNHITDVKPLQALPKLQVLDLSYNKIVDFEVLQNLTNLQKLYVEENPGKCPTIFNPICLRIDL